MSDKPSGWVSVEDELPDTDRDVYVYVAGKKYGIGEYWGDDKEGGWYVTTTSLANNFDERVTHWREKPEPPE